MSAPDFDRKCPIHFSVLDANGECSWCRIAQRLPPYRKPYTLTPDDIAFLRERGIDPEVPHDPTYDAGGD